MLELNAGAFSCQNVGREQRFIVSEEGKSVREDLEHHGSSAVDEEAHESGATPSPLSCVKLRQDREE